jgi:MoaE-MoaD fusion protein
MASGGIRVRVLFFGVLKEIAGTASEVIELQDVASVRHLLAHYEAKAPRLKRWMSSVAIAVNQQYCNPDTKLKSDDEVALLPPVSGGKAGADQKSRVPLSEASGSTHARFVRDTIDSQRTVSSLKRGDDGAVVVFEGTVRNQTRGRRTLYLDYEAYEEMALQQMESLAIQALGQFQIRDLAIVHRLGRIEIGEASVLLAVVAAHRGAAFDACRWLIDTLKRTVPIWKKEHFADGAVWADGEPFPQEIPRANSPSNSSGNSSAQGSPAAGSASK